MRFKSILYKDKKYESYSKIIDVLRKEKLFWLIDSEVVDAEIEIKNKTLIWHSGKYLNGTWYYGIFKSGDFYGIWENGIFEGGNFSGVWKSGVKNKNN